MFGPRCTRPLDALMLALESPAVIGLRLAKLARGGTAAACEAERMVSEKVAAATEAAMVLATGGDAGAVIAGYRGRVRANRLRLAGV